MIHVVSYHSPKQYLAFAKKTDKVLPICRLSEALRSEKDCVVFAPVERFQNRTVKPLDSQDFYKNTMRRLSWNLPEIQTTKFLDELLSLENNKSLLKDIMLITYSLSTSTLQQKFMYHISRFMCSDISFIQLSENLDSLGISNRVMHNLQELLSSDEATTYRDALVVYTETTAKKVASEFGVPEYDLNYFRFKRDVMTNDVDEKVS